MNEDYCEEPNKDKMGITYYKIQFYLNNGFSIPDILKEVQHYGECCKISQLRHNDEKLESKTIELQQEIARLHSRLAENINEIKGLKEEKGYNDLRTQLKGCVEERESLYESICEIADILEGLGVVIKED